MTHPSTSFWAIEPRLPTWLTTCAQRWNCSAPFGSVASVSRLRRGRAVRELLAHPQRQRAQLRHSDWLRRHHHPEANGKSSRRIRNVHHNSAYHISCAWDALIEKFNTNILGGTSYFTSNPRIADGEKLLRSFALQTYQPRPRMFPYFTRALYRPGSLEAGCSRAEGTTSVSRPA